MRTNLRNKAPIKITIINKEYEEPEDDIKHEKMDPHGNVKQEKTRAHKNGWIARKNQQKAYQ